MMAMLTFDVPDRALTLSFTLHLWWLWAYLAIGVASWFPLEVSAWRHTARHKPFWPWLGKLICWKPFAPLAVMALWPIAIWEEVR